jgi:hypothetical protein
MGICRSFIELSDISLQVSTGQSDEQMHMRADYIYNNPKSLANQIPLFKLNIGWEGGKAMNPSKNNFLADNESDKVTYDVVPVLLLATGFINPSIKPRRQTATSHYQKAECATGQPTLQRC